jgi:proteic killer suppression protein
VIENFRHEGLRLFYEDVDRMLPMEMGRRIAMALADLDAASRLEDMDRPSFRLHTLSGKLLGFHGITISANWRIVFRFDGENVYDVDLVDYYEPRTPLCR